MGTNKRGEREAVGPVEERVEGDEVAFDERIDRADGGGAGAFVAPGAPRRTARTVSAADGRVANFTGEQRLLLLDAWLRSGLPATEFCALVGVSSHTLYQWRKRFEEQGPAGLLGRRKGRSGSRLPESTRRSILMMKEAHPDWGQDRLHDMLIRAEGFSASPSAIQRVLLEAGYGVEESRTRPHPPKVRRFECTHPNGLWQTDLFTFTLKRQNRRVHLVGYLDDYSRFVVGFGLHASASGALVREVFERAIANFGAPKEILTDNGTQYHTWRGKSAFRKLCVRRGIEQIVASPRHPQTLGKIERFWGTLWRDLVEGAVFRDLEEARERLAHFIAYYNFQRTHQGIGGLVPADRYFEAAVEIRAALEKRVAENAKELALHGEPRKSVYMTGRVGGKAISLHGEGTKVILTDAEGVREEVDLEAPGRRMVEEAAPGTSALDGVLEDVERIQKAVPGTPEARENDVGEDSAEDAEAGPSEGAS